MNGNFPSPLGFEFVQLKHFAALSFQEESIDFESLAYFRATFTATLFPTVDVIHACAPLKPYELPFSAFVLIACRDLIDQVEGLDRYEMYHLGGFISFATHMFTMSYDVNVPDATKKKILDKAQSAMGRAAANARHNQKGGAAEKRAKVLEAWATGAYKTRNACAEAVYKPLCISYETARKHLINSPEPNKKGS